MVLSIQVKDRKTNPSLSQRSQSIELLQMSDLSREHEQLAYLLLSPAWEALYKARVAQEVKVLYQQLLDPSQKRKDKQPDDFIRGMIAGLRFAIEWPEQEMELAAQQVRDEAEQEGETVIPLFGNRQPEPKENGNG